MTQGDASLYVFQDAVLNTMPVFVLFLALFLYFDEKVRGAWVANR